MGTVWKENAENKKAKTVIEVENAFALLIGDLILVKELINLK